MKTGGIILLPSFGFLLRKNRGRSINYSVCFRRLFSLASSSQASYLSRPRLLKHFPRALNHSAAPPLPKKSVGLFGDPGIYYLRSKIHRFHPGCLHRASLSGEKQTKRQTT